MMRIAISGFGRIGKVFLKAAIESGALGRDFEVVAINARSPVESHAHLFKHDSVYGKFQGSVSVKDGNLIINDRNIKWIRETDPLKLPWQELEVDVVLESTGAFKSKDECQKHIRAGAKRVLLSAPGKGVDATIVPGVNDYNIGNDALILSLASCTTNCLAPVLKTIHSKFGIEKGFLSTIHAYTNDQRTLDGSHKDLRRARAAAINIIPTTTGAAAAIGAVIPELDGRLDGIAYRVPVPDGSMNDMCLLLSRQASADEINRELYRASGEELKGILGYTDEPIVSSDIIGDSHSSVVDSLLTRSNGNLAKISSWYDNEFGYSSRLVDLLKKLSRLS